MHHQSGFVFRSFVYVPALSRYLLSLTTTTLLLPLLVIPTASVAGITVNGDQIDNKFSPTTPEKIGEMDNAGRSGLPPLVFEPYVEHRVYGAWVGNQSDKGMDLLYKAVNAVLKELQPNKFPHEFLLSDDDLRDPKSLVTSLRANYLDWLKYEKGFLLAGGVCLALAVIFTVLYIFYAVCCCCCCRRDSGKPRSDKRCDACKRRAYTGVLAVFTVIMIFAVACALISNQYVHETASRLPEKLQYGMEDFEAYKDETGRRVKKLLITDYGTLNSTILSAIKKASGVVVNRVKEISGAASLDHLSEISDKAIELESHLSRLEHNMESIKQNADSLKYNMHNLHQDAAFQNGLKQCLDRTSEDQKTCRDVDSLLNQYKDLPDTILDFGRFSSLKGELQEVAKHNISALLSEARYQFSTLEERFHSALAKRENTLKYHLNKYSQNFTHHSERVANELQKVDVKAITGAIESHKEFFVDNEFYRWISGIVICCVVGVMVLCFGFGLFYGVCGRRPSYYEDDCCVRSTGSKLYCGGVTIGVLFVAVLMVVTCSLFLIGANSQNLICDTVKRPNERRDVLDAVQRFINLRQQSESADIGRVLGDTKLHSILNGCDSNETLYEIFGVEEQLGIRDLLNGNATAYRDLSEALESLRRDFHVEGNLNRVLISPEAEDKLRQLKGLNLSALPQNIINELEEKVASFDILSELSFVEAEVNATIGREMQFLRQFVADLKELEKTKLEPLKKQLESMMGDLKALNTQLPNLTVEVPRWISALVDAQSLLATNLTGYINSVASEVAGQLKKYIEEYRIHIRQQLHRNVTSCEPLKAMGRASAITVCDRLIYPFNSFWASIAVCLLLSIPSIMLATSLIDLYKNTERYCKSNFYSDTAEIPLNGLAGGSSSTGRTRGRNSRVNAYVTDDYDHYSRVNNNATIKPHGSSANGYANWRTPSNSSYLDTIGSPPPPYSSPKRRNR